MSTTQKDPASKTPEGTLSSALFVDLGKHKRKDVKQLREGKGPLAQAVLETLADLKDSGNASNGPIVIIVKEKDRKGLRLF